MPRTIILAVWLPAPPARLYEMYIDPELHAAFTGMPGHDRNLRSRCAVSSFQRSDLGKYSAREPEAPHRSALAFGKLSGARDRFDAHAFILARPDGRSHRIGSRQRAGRRFCRRQRRLVDVLLESLAQLPRTKSIKPSADLLASGPPRRISPPVLSWAGSLYWIYEINLRPLPIPPAARVERFSRLHFGRRPGGRNLARLVHRL